MVVEHTRNKSSTRQNCLSRLIMKWRSRTQNRASPSPKEEHQETVDSHRDGHIPQSVINSDRDRRSYNGVNC